MIDASGHGDSDAAIVRTSLRAGMCIGEPHPAAGTAIELADAMQARVQVLVLRARSVLD